MSQEPSELPTDRETEILHILWKLKEGTAEEIRSQLSDDPHDSTVRTLLRIMESKGLITHHRQGRQFVYHALVEQGKTQRSAIKMLLHRFFGGSADALLMHLVDEKELTAEDLEEIARATKAPKRGSE